MMEVLRSSREGHVEIKLTGRISSAWAGCEEINR